MNIKAVIPKKSDSTAISSQFVRALPNHEFSSWCWLQNSHWPLLNEMATVKLGMNKTGKDQWKSSKYQQFVAVLVIWFSGGCCNPALQSTFVVLSVFAPCRNRAQREWGEHVHLPAAASDLHSDGQWASEERVLLQLQWPCPQQQTLCPCGPGCWPWWQRLRRGLQLRPQDLPLRKFHRHTGIKVKEQWASSAHCAYPGCDMPVKTWVGFYPLGLDGITTWSCFVAMCVIKAENLHVLLVIS